MNPEDYIVMTNGDSNGSIGTITIPNPTSVIGIGVTNGINTVNIRPTYEDILEEYSMNNLVVDHKVQAQELLKLQEVAPDYATEIKHNLSKKAAQEIVKKMTFTKKHDKIADVHHFIGRVWVLTEDELKEMMIKAKNVY